jgi:hypothetical protein
MIRNRFPSPVEAARSEAQRKLDAQKRAERDAALKAETQARSDRLRQGNLAREIKRGIEQGKREFAISSGDESLMPALIQDLEAAGWSGKLDQGHFTITPAKPATPPLIRLLELVVTNWSK